MPINNIEQSVNFCVLLIHFIGGRSCNNPNNNAQQSSDKCRKDSLYSGILDNKYKDCTHYNSDNCSTAKPFSGALI